MIKIIKRLDKHTTLECEVPTNQLVIQFQAFWDQIPSLCLTCGASTRFEYRTPQGFAYYSVICDGSAGKGQHEAKFGEHKPEHGGGLFFYGDWDDAYVGGGPESQGPDSYQEPAPVAPQVQKSEPDLTDEDIPF